MHVAQVGPDAVELPVPLPLVLEPEVDPVEVVEALAEVLVDAASDPLTAASDEPVLATEELSEWLSFEDPWPVDWVDAAPELCALVDADDFPPSTAATVAPSPPHDHTAVAATKRHPQRPTRRRETSGRA